jgi:hypothetical protein
MFFFSLLSHASEPVNRNGEYRFLVNGVARVPLFDYQYNLLTENPDERLLLDCQSFIQGMKVYWFNGVEEVLYDALLLSGGECQYIAYNVFTSSSQEKELCLKINPDKFTIKVGDDPDLCFN